jgi:hypothetical protein
MVQVDTLSGSDELLPSESPPLAWLLSASSLLEDLSLLLEGLFLLLFLPLLFLSDAFFFSRSLSFFLSLYKVKTTFGVRGAGGCQAHSAPHLNVTS